MPEVPPGELLHRLSPPAAADLGLEQPARSTSSRMADAGEPELPRHRGPEGHRVLRLVSRPGSPVELRDLPPRRSPGREPAPLELPVEALDVRDQRQAHVPDMPPLDRQSRMRAVAALLAAAALAGCSSGVSQQLGQAKCDDSYAQGVGPLLQSRCASCHGAGQAEGDYRVDSYLGAVARRPDGTYRARAGDDDSLVLQAARGTLPSGHTALAQSE